jgi:uncharacterized protein (TIGR03435 family)
MSLGPLLLRAYSLMPYQLDGPAKLLDGATYDITAKIPLGATADDVNLMLQGLLAERFGLAVHWAMKKHSAYELTIAKGGLRMKEAAPPSADGAPVDDPAFPRRDGWMVLRAGTPAISTIVRNGITRITGRMQRIDGLVRGMERLIDQPIVDRTGLTGKYDFHLMYAQDPLAAAVRAAAQPSSGQPPLQGEAGDASLSLAGAFEEQLGLKLRSVRLPVKVLVVDHLNKTPTEN